MINMINDKMINKIKKIKIKNHKKSQKIKKKSPDEGLEPSATSLKGWRSTD